MNVHEQPPDITQTKENSSKSVISQISVEIQRSFDVM